jgi:hypothetical protein
MLTTIEGVFRNGTIELSHIPRDIDEAKVLVTFLTGDAGPIDLAARGIEPAAAADLRHRLQSFSDDWNRPEMDVYDAP